MMRSQSHIANARYHYFADPPADLQLDKDAISASFCRNNNLARWVRRLRIAVRLPKCVACIIFVVQSRHRLVRPAERMEDALSN